ERVQKELVLLRVPVDPRVERQRIFSGELRHLQREERPLVVLEFGRADADDRQLEPLRENVVELRDAARPRVQVIPGDTVDQSSPGTLARGVDPCRGHLIYSV